MKNYKYFILFIWFGFGSTFFLQKMDSAPILEIALVSSSITLILYLFTNFIYTPIMLKAIKGKNIPLFITQTLSMSIVEATILALIGETFSQLEHFGVIPIYGIIINLMNISFNDWLSMFFITILINFGTYGFTFYKENMELHKILAESQLKTLQAQINPHFMFNVLNHIDILMRKDVVLASDLLLKYSEILRYQLYSGEKEQITIVEEIDFLKSFIEVEKIRWKDKLNVTCSWNIDNNDFTLPPLLLIIFIENAFKHVSRSTSKKGYITIKLEQKDDVIQLNIENSKSIIENIPKSNSGIGLENIKKRLSLLYPKKHSLTITDSALIYYTKLIIRTHL